MNRTRVFLVLAASLSLMLLPSCSSAPKSSGGAIKIAVVTNNPQDFWSIAEAGAQKAAGEEKIELIFKRPQGGTAAEQKQIIEDVLAQGVQGIAISVINPVDQLDFLNEVAEKVPLLTQDNDAPKSKRKCYIGTDNYLAGREVGKLVKEALPDGGAIAIFVGDSAPLNAKQRRQGVLDELAGMKDAPEGKMYGKYELIGSFYDGVQPRKAKDNAADVLTKESRNDLCMVGLWAYNPPAILSAVKDAKREGKVKIVGFDEDDDTLYGIRDGFIHATVVQQPFEFGYQSVKLLTALARDPAAAKLPADGIQYVPHKVIRKDNVGEFHKSVRQMTHKSPP